MTIPTFHLLCYRLKVSNNKKTSHLNLTKKYNVNKKD